MRWQVQTLVASFSGAVTAPGIMLISDYNFTFSIALAGITASTFGGFIAIQAERDYQRERGENSQ